MFLWKKSLFLSLCLSLAPVCQDNHSCQMTRCCGVCHKSRSALPCHLAFLFRQGSLSPSIIITVNNDLRSLRVFYLRDILAYGKNLTSFPSTIFCSQALSSGSQLGSVLGHLSLAKTRGSFLPDSIPLTGFLSYDSLILFSVLRNPLH